MSIKELVIQSQLVPPRQRKGLLRRPRLEARLAAVVDFPLIIVQAGAGYGKSTALAALAEVVDRLAWYSITEPDRDPLLDFYLFKWFGEGAAFLMGALYVILVLFVPYGIVGAWRLRSPQWREGWQQRLSMLKRAGKR